MTEVSSMFQVEKSFNQNTSHHSRLINSTHSTGRGDESYKNQGTMALT